MELVALFAQNAATSSFGGFLVVAADRLILLFHYAMVFIDSAERSEVS